MKIILYLALTSLFIASCIRAGEGGSAILTVNVFVDTAGHLCTDCQVYIYYGDSSYQSVNKESYDDEGITNAYGQHSFSPLRRGEYSIYAWGIDPIYGDTVAGRVGEDIQDSETERHVTINAKKID
jgi:hypothetical protein